MIILRKKGHSKHTLSKLNNVRVISNNKIIQNKNYGVVFRWGCTSVIIADKIINKSSEIVKTSNKLEFRRLLNKSNLCPKTWFNIEDDIIFPVILRKKKHSAGKDLFFIKNKEELVLKINELNNEDYYISEYIEKEKEFRVFVGSGRIIGVVEKIPEDRTQIAWNHSLGASFKNVKFSEWPLKTIFKALKAIELTNLDFGAVDIIVDNNNRSYVLEINTAPTISNNYILSCVNKYIDYISLNGSNKIKLVNKKGNFKKFIHPCIYNEAWLTD